MQSELHSNNVYQNVELLLLVPMLFLLAIPLGTEYIAKVENDAACKKVTNRTFPNSCAFGNWNGSTAKTVCRKIERSTDRAFTDPRWLILWKPGFLITL